MANYQPKLQYILDIVRYYVKVIELSSELTDNTDSVFGS